MKPKQPRAPTVFDEDGFVPHKGHYHDQSGKKFAEKPMKEIEGDDHVDHTKPPTEKQVIEKTVDIERRKNRLGKRKMSTANTVLSEKGSLI